MVRSTPSAFTYKNSSLSKEKCHKPALPSLAFVMSKSGNKKKRGENGVLQICTSSGQTGICTNDVEADLHTKELLVDAVTIGN